MIGPGTYDDECTLIRERTQADAVLLMVTNGERGSGFSMQTNNPATLASLPHVLRSLADQIEADYHKGIL